MAILGGLAMRLLGLASVGLFLASMSADAANLCNCCAAGVAENCSAACASATPTPNQCVAMPDYEGEAAIGVNENPLYGISLLSIELEDATRPQLDDFRRLLENSRRGLEKDRKASMRDFRKRKIDKATVQANTQRYERAIVNYYLGWRAYRDRLAAVPMK
jgi:hypothetical protein